jgi:ribosomal-protein-serine acetyltransferase
MSARIRPYQPSDVAALFEAAVESTEAVFPWLPWCHPGYQAHEAQAWVERQVAAFAAGTEYEFVIESPAGRLLGGCGLNALDRDHRRANLGYWVRSSETGRGVASTAAREAMRWAFANTDLIRLEILAAVGNVASQRVAEKAGAVREGVLRQRLLVHGVSHDAAVFSFIRAGRAR